MNKWIKRGGNGALWLLAATLLTKLIGVLQKIPLQNLGGDTVFGLYNMVYPLYQLMLILAISGIPTVISIMIAESDIKQREQLAKVSHKIMLIVGLILAVSLYSLARPISQLLGSEQLISMLYIVALTICVTPLLASYRGYFQAVKLASYSSLSQLVEQLIRVAIMVILLYIGIQQSWSDVAIATYVMWGGVVGGAFALAMLYMVKYRSDKGVKIDKFNRNNALIFRAFLKQGMPALIASAIVPLLSVIDSFSIAPLLSSSLSFNTITTQFGLYSRIQPLVQLVTMLLAASLAGAIPSIVENKYQSALTYTRHKQLNTILYYAVIIGSAASIGLYILAEPISIMLYKNTLGVAWFRLLSLTTLPAAILTVITPIFLIEGKNSRLLFMGIVSIVLKLILNIIFVSSIGSMQGAAYATLITLYSVVLIALIEPLQKGTIKAINWVSLTKSIVALIAMAISLFSIRMLCELLFKLPVEHRLVASLYTIILVLLGAIVVVSFLIKFKMVTKQEIKQLMK